ncbi:periplasmic beta-glucosidase beta-xylosidase [Fusarium sp. NRRL 25303]|nr:periplasmic beta-glucosidase beta-xylosidase [Fusarium sp. NRRL 25303]
MWSSLLLLGGVSLSIANPIVRQDANPPYRNKTLCLDKRVDDLMSRMSLEDKAGQMFHGRTVVVNNTFDETIEEFVTGKRITHYVLSGGVNDVRGVANWYNKLQRLAMSTPLGIPSEYYCFDDIVTPSIPKHTDDLLVTISSDPQHGWTDENAVSVVAQGFSRWTEPLGLAALRSPELVRQFAEIAREEYVAVGIRQALHPQVDLATEPRWGRITGTMGEDANLTSALMVEYIKGLQGDKIGPNSVIATTKHFPGGGPMEDGEDSHFPWGKNQTYPGNNRDYHLIPFKAAIAAGTRQMMPYYSRPINTSWEEVAFGFNKGVVNDLLKKELGFDGIVVTDWGIVTTRFWGLEDQTELERARRVLEAGCDIFGGETKPELIIELVNKGLISEARIDESVRKLMKEKFELGLFDNPFVDVDKAERIAGNDYFSRLGNETQRRAFTLLTNKDDVLPLPLSALNAKFYIEGIEPEVMESRNLSVVENPEDADYAFLRLASPFKPTTAPGLPAMINNGSLEFNTTEKARQAKIYATLPTVVDIRLNRPAAVPEVAEQAVALFGSYGSSHDAFLDVVFGIDGWGPEGRLPFDLPVSQEAADAQKEDVPFDVEALFKFGHGLRYKDTCDSS